LPKERLEALVPEALDHGVAKCDKRRFTTERVELIGSFTLAIAARAR